jgi:UTP--glucose-1-phosphate uridylyltransferase
MTKESPMKVRKAVIAAAGFGTRFLPQTKAMPKEMLPLVDKPIIQYIVEELVDAGIEDIIIVTGYHKRTIEDHFDLPNADLINNLRDGGKDALIEQTEAVSNMANFVYLRQKGLYGTATPLLCAEHLIQDEPFLYTYADDFVVASPSRFSQLVSVYKENPGSSVLTCIDADKPGDYERYGYIAGDEQSEGLYAVRTIIEKPGSKEKAPSSVASVGGYLFDSALFPYLHEQKTLVKPDEEIMIQPAMQRMINDGHAMFGLKTNGKYYDAGNKLEYVKTIVDFALQREDIKDEFREYLEGVVKER